MSRDISKTGETSPGLELALTGLIGTSSPCSGRMNRSPRLEDLQHAPRSRREQRVYMRASQNDGGSVWAAGAAGSEA